MRLLYSIGIFLYGLLLRILAPFHTKARLMVTGRKDWYLRMKQSVDSSQKHIWFHFASLGEFEQGRPVLEAVKNNYLDHKIIVTFYSPSGYEIRKNTNLADHVFYLPYDTAQNAKLFLDLINPSFAVFTKYEYWYYYFEGLHSRSIPLFLVSAIFRPEQIFFQAYGTFFLKILGFVTYFFVQNEESVRLLKEYGIRNAGLAGDTRFDRVIDLPKVRKEIPLIADFVGTAPVLVAGSTWPEDEKLLKELFQQFSEYKLILAPHEINEGHIVSILNLWPAALRFSKMAEYETVTLTEAKVLIIDNIGLLSSLYGYGEVAYIGGGFGVGIHNTLEAATYGMPVLFGPNFKKFQEAKDLIEQGGGFSFADSKGLMDAFGRLQDQSKRAEAAKSARQYVQQKAGATPIIMKYLKNANL
ncbi:3-deoxy-D-manno-octulosonic acid transferase [Sphingobacterium sp. ML3W]|uniref:3-deoxy-D-manno-octulosonic acid transferase n=1 Tax=Sphingobacterium sp. ML3W TaxID=1538644 RepID=UPI00249AF03E|nr:glycosyltransferase N-terminal domain-containing protein [Sphingobacterium sp. ML3W]WFA78007.1 3-deoxy-D-manno-octulosonic acid transferase [Sphingobacterium sp. ML3W]